jgi:hypothetical protein
MSNSRRMLVAALATVVAIGFGATLVGADEDVFLGYKFEEGYSKDYKVKFNQEIDYGGFAFSQIIDMEVTEKCVGSEEDLFLMEMVFNKVDAARMQFDNMEQDPNGERLVGQTVTFKVDSHGETSEMRPAGYIDGWDQIKEIVDRVVDNWYAYLPNEAVAKGGKWTKVDEPEEELGLIVEGKADYVFKELKKEKGALCAKIEAKIENTLRGTQDTPAGVMTVDGGGTGDSEFFFCTTTSTIVKYKVKVEMKMDMTPEAGGDATETTVNVVMERAVK